MVVIQQKNSGKKMNCGNMNSINLIKQIQINKLSFFTKDRTLNFCFNMLGKR